MSTQTSNSMFQTLIQRIMEAARSSDNLCIIGEVGTGKRQAAVSVHRASGADEGRLSIVNCMALDHENFLSDLFGRVTPDGELVRKGAVALAEGGTLYLHEVQELTRESQAALVRFLETKTYRPVGSGMTLSSSVRLIVSSSATLEALVEAGKFRQDLQHFLTPLIIHMPRLNDRLEDIPTLFKTLLFQVGGGRSISIDDDALVRLKSHSYTGNLLELRNLALRCVSSMKNDHVTLKDVEAAIRGTAYFDLADQASEGAYAELARQAGDTQYQAIAAATSPTMLAGPKPEQDGSASSGADNKMFDDLNQHMSMDKIVGGQAEQDGPEAAISTPKPSAEMPATPEPKRTEGGPPNLKDVERKYFLDLIENFKGDKSQVAKASGLNLRTLYRRLKSLDIE
jgi:DNA-binding NtrC family response regulator